MCLFQGFLEYIMQAIVTIKHCNLAFFATEGERVFCVRNLLFEIISVRFVLYMVVSTVTCYLILEP